MSTLQARNQSVIKAPIDAIWSVITDISQLPKVNPGVVKATGRMDKQGKFRTCEIINHGRKGTMVERMVELVPQSDTMGMSRMLRETRFVFNLEKLTDNETVVVTETFYEPNNFFATILNKLIMKRMINKAQDQILANIKVLTEK